MHRNTRYKIPKGNFIIIIFILNLFFYGLSYCLGYKRALINLDFVLPLLFPFSNFLVSLILGAIVIIELTTITAHLFYFTPVSFIASGALPFINETRLMPLMITFAFVVVYAFFILVFEVTLRAVNTKRSSGVNRAVVIFLIVVVSLDVLAGGFYNNGNNSAPLRFLNLNVSTSGIARIASEIRSSYFLSKNVVEAKPVDSALGQTLAGFGLKRPSDKFVLIILESFGLFSKLSDNDFILKEFSGLLNASYNVHAGKVKFSGATTAAEVRELLGVEGDYNYMRSLAGDNVRALRVFSNNSYHMTGFHYYYRSAFNRDVWWSRAGLTHQRFLDSLGRSEIQLAGGFLNGGYDRKLIADIFNSLNISDKVFAYGLTLNSHLPVHINKDIKAMEDKPLVGFNGSSDNVKTLVNSWRVVFHEIANQLNNVRRDNVTVVIVGDHAPPFVNLRDRLIFNQTYVAYIVVTSSN